MFSSFDVLIKCDKRLAKTLDRHIHNNDNVLACSSVFADAVPVVAVELLKWLQARNSRSAIDRSARISSTPPPMTTNSSHTAEVSRRPVDAGVMLASFMPRLSSDNVCDVKYSATGSWGVLRSRIIGRHVTLIQQKRIGARLTEALGTYNRHDRTGHIPRMTASMSLPLVQHDDRLSIINPIYTKTT